MKMNDYLIYFSDKYNGDWDKIYYALKTVEYVEKKSLIDLQDKKNETETKCITILDENYPKMFNILKKPPFVMYYRGNIKLLEYYKKIHITGNYEPEYIGKYLALIKELPNDCVIVNANWKGLDEKILNTCIQNDKKIIVILSCGISCETFEKLEHYMKSNNILILSEYPNDYHISKKTLLARNRLISALSNSMIILASQDKFLYGLIDSFLNVGKEIYCFGPEINDVNNDNSNLINAGAKLINNFSLPLADNYLI